MAENGNTAKLERVLGLDVGTKRIGVAISDPMRIFARELELVIRKTDEIAIQRIIEICEEYSTRIVVVGVPYNSDDNDISIGPQAKNCIDFANLLKQTFEKETGNALKIELIDESLTSFEAEELLKKENVRYTKNKGLVDLKSACLILGEYLR